MCLNSGTFIMWSAVRLGLTTLEQRRRGDLIETYMILKVLENLDYNVFFEFSEDSTRSNTCKLNKRGQWKTQSRVNSFSVRVINA